MSFEAPVILKYFVVGAEPSYKKQSSTVSLTGDEHESDVHDFTFNPSSVSSYSVIDVKDDNAEFEKESRSSPKRTCPNLSEKAGT